MHVNQAIDAFLSKCNPAPISQEETLKRVRLQITGLSEFAAKAAERAMPGFGEMMEKLLLKEAELAAEIEK